MMQNAVKKVAADLAKDFIKMGVEYMSSEENRREIIETGFRIVRVLIAEKVGG